MRIDLHTHILPKAWPDLSQRYGVPGWVSLDHYAPCCARMMIDGKPFRDIRDNCWDPQRRIDECAACRVDMQVLSTVPVMFNYHQRAEHTHDLSRLLNDHLAEVVRAHPKHFAGLGTLPMQSADRACDELRRCVRDLNLRGVQIGTNIDGQNLDSPAHRPFFAEAERLGAAVFIHPWDMLGRDRTGKYWMPWLVGMPAETCVAICSVLFSGLLDEFPKLRLCFAHAGGSFPGTVGRIDHGYHARPDLCAVDTQMSPRTYLAHESTGTPARFWVDSLTHDPDALRAVIKLFSPQRVALGSDYPFPLGEDRPGAMIDAMPDLSAETKEHLLCRSALTFLG